MFSTSRADREQKPCACTQSFRHLMLGAQPKRDWLRKTTCPGCKKKYWTNRGTDYCLDCEPQASTKAHVT